MCVDQIDWHACWYWWIICYNSLTWWCADLAAFFVIHLHSQAALIVADKEQSLQISGNGDVLEPHDGIISIGSGSPYALAAARALIDVPGMDAMTIARKAMTIAGDACVYTNHNTSILHIDSDGQVSEVTSSSELANKDATAS